MADDAPNPRIFEGANNPPEATPYEAVKVHVDDLMAEARQWLDGEPVTTQAQADGVSKLMDELRKASKAADAARRDEAKPFDDGKAEVQARYKPLLESAGRGVETCKAVLAPFLKAAEDARQAAAAAARREAEEAAAVARQASLDAAFGSLEEREAVDAAVKVAKAAENAARAVEKSRSHATGGARATTLRAYYVATITDEAEAARWAWRVHRPEMVEFIEGLAKQRIAGGVRQIDGFAITSEQRVV